MLRRLLPEAIKKQIPALYAQESEKDPMVYAKLYMPLSNWIWLITECEGDRCFGYVIGQDKELGYFNLQELSEAKILLPVINMKTGTIINIPYNAVECDTAFKPKLLSAAKNECL